MDVIRIKDLSFQYPEGKSILNGVTMNVRKGSIYGFIGANGAGKSTTIRIILGLLKSETNCVHIFGKNPFLGSNIETFKKIGFLIDKPVFYNHLTCNENLVLLAHYYAYARNDIEAALSTVGLLDQKNVVFHRCSTGMKQRLAIAKAIVHKPEVLILDEPFNGLDPEWVFEMRNCLRDLNSHGMTIFYSSHILGEMEKLVTDVGVLKNGKIVIEASIDDLLNNANQLDVFVRLESTEKIQTLNFNSPDIAIAEELSDNVVHFNLKNKNLLNELITTLVNYHYTILDIRISKPTLEELFLKTAI